MITKQKGDLAEQATILRFLELGYGVARPIGDRLSYDLIIDVKGKLGKIQVKCAWYDSKNAVYCVDVRRTKTNRQKMVRDLYTRQDFDFALVYLIEKRIFYVIPVDVFISFRSTVTLALDDSRQRKPKSADYFEAFDLISKWAVSKEISI